MKTFTTYLLPLVAPILVAVLAWLSARLTALISAKVKAEDLRNVLLRLNDTTFAVVREVFQNYVDAQKAEDPSHKLTEDQARTAKSIALDTLKAHLGTAGISEIGKTLGLPAYGVDRYLGTKIEAAVNSTKRLAPIKPPLAS